MTHQLLKHVSPANVKQHTSKTLQNKTQHPFNDNYSFATPPQHKNSEIFKKNKLESDLRSVVLNKVARHRNVEMQLEGIRFHGGRSYGEVVSSAACAHRISMSSAFCFTGFHFLTATLKSLQSSSSLQTHRKKPTDVR